MEYIRNEIVQGSALKNQNGDEACHDLMSAGSRCHSGREGIAGTEGFTEMFSATSVAEVALLVLPATQYLSVMRDKY